MFGIGGAELVVVVIILLLFVGPDELPKVARTVGKGLTDLRRAANVAQAELQETMQELTREVDSLQRDVKDAGKDLLSVRTDVEHKLDQLDAQPAVAAAGADDEVTVIPRRRSAEPAAVPADPWQAAHRPPDEPADTEPGVDGVDAAAPTAAAADSAADPAADPAIAPRAGDQSEAPKPAFRMPGAPVAGTVSRSATAPVAVAAPSEPDAAAPSAPTSEAAAAEEPEATHA